MKKISLMLALGLSVSALAQMTFQEKPWKDLLADAKKNNKLIFVDAYASWCGPCKLMAKNIFTKSTVGDYYNANFINTKIDMEKGEGVTLAKKYGVKAYPTYLFVNGDGEVMYRGTGYYEENDFINIGKEANDPNKQLAVLNKRFNAGEKDPEFLKNYMTIYMYADTDLARAAAERYFAGKKGQPLTKEDIGYLFQLTGNSKTSLYQEVLKRKAELLQVMPEEKYNEFLKAMQMQSVMKEAYNKDTKVLNDNVFLAEAKKFLTPEEANKALTSTKMKLAFSAKNYAEWARLAQNYYGDGSKYSSNELNSIAWNFFEKMDDKASIQKAIKWAQLSVQKDESYANTDTLANLYLKAGDKKNAKLWASKSIELAKKSGEDYASTQKVLEAASR